MGNAGLEHENRENNGNQENDEHKEFLSLGAGAILALIPTFLLYLVAQKSFMQSMALNSGIK